MNKYVGVKQKRFPGTVGFLAVTSAAGCAVAANAEVLAPPATGASVWVGMTVDVHRVRTDSFGAHSYRAVTVYDDLVGERARDVIGSRGVERLREFTKLGRGWDGRDASELSRASVDRFSDFFALTNLRPNGISVFMSKAGNLIVNWEKSDGLVELEFTPNELMYFIEGTSEEGTVAASALGMWNVWTKLT